LWGSMAQHVFGPFLLDVDERRFLRDGDEIRLRGKLFDTLCVLVENPGRLLRKDELLQAVWPDTIVEENNLDHCISQLRKVFGTANNFIETVPRQGYRFTAEVKAPNKGPRLVSVTDSPSFDDAPDQEIRYFTTSDGVRLAYTIGGDGAPLVRAIDWINHLDFEWKNPFLRHWFSEIMRHNTFMRYDQRGSGLSDWNVDDFSFERSVNDFEELIEETGFDKFSIMGSCQGGAIAISYAVRHPERVSKLILVGAFASGWPSQGSMAIEQFNAMLTLIRLGWGRDNPAFRQLWTTLFRPDATPEEIEWMNELQRITASPENASRMLAEFPKVNVVDMLPKVSCPTLVIHSREDAVVPVSEGRLIASRIRGSRFVELPSPSHQVDPGKPAWKEFVDEFSRFLAWEPERVATLQRSSTA
jgi:pimeloyl-ACP methyl ester carboxylesterase/DNA-binding winged helix-turn-helix (wHTH) protein